jgi:hypothetical protein
MVELLVAFTLLVAVLGTLGPAVVRHGRMLLSARHYRTALDEASNQLERLASLPTSELAKRVSDAKLSTFAAARLPEGALAASLTPGDESRRIVVEVSWSEAIDRRSSVRLAAWTAAGDGRRRTRSPQEDLP